jgi:hypothetical protein
MKIWIIALALVACSKSNEDKAKDLGNKAEVEAKKAGHELAKPVGDVADFATGMTALCAAAPAEPVTAETLSAATGEALRLHPNAEVVTFWKSVGSLPMTDIVARLREQATKAKLATCPLADKLDKK